MDHALLALYHQHVAAAFDRQMRLGEFLKRETNGKSWNYTISTATLTFDDSVHFTALDLGSHADPDNSWFWSWCHPQLNLTQANRKLGEAVRKVGLDRGIEAFTADGQLSCSDVLGPDLSPVAAHAFATIIGGELKFDAYYVIPFTHGRSVAMIRDGRLQGEIENPAARMVSLFSQVLAAFPVLDHRAAFIGYAASYGLAVNESPQTVRVMADGKETLRATFDKLNRLTKLAGKFGPEN